MAVLTGEKSPGQTPGLAILVVDAAETVRQIFDELDRSARSTLREDAAHADCPLAPDRQLRGVRRAAVRDDAFAFTGSGEKRELTGSLFEEWMRSLFW